MFGLLIQHAFLRPEQVSGMHKCENMDLLVSECYPPPPLSVEESHKALRSQHHLFDYELLQYYGARVQGSNCQVWRRLQARASCHAANSCVSICLQGRGPAAVAAAVPGAFFTSCVLYLHFGPFLVFSYFVTALCTEKCTAVYQTPLQCNVAWLYVRCTLGRNVVTITGLVHTCPLWIGHYATPSVTLSYE